MCSFLTEGYLKVKSGVKFLLKDKWSLCGCFFPASIIERCSTMVSLLGFGMLSLVFLVLLAFPSLTLQSCIDSSPVGDRMAQSGYATCHFLDYENHNLLYITGFQRKMGSHNDLRDIKDAKCCQPPDVHKGKPHTCTSADWDLSFSRYVVEKTALFLFLKLPPRKASAPHIIVLPR